MNNMLLKTAVIGLATIALCVVGAKTFTKVHADDDGANVTICHWDSGHNAYKPPQSVSENSIYKLDHSTCKTDGHGKDPLDIIPSFVNGSCTFAGLNTDKISWIANNCQAPAPKVDGACGTEKNTCTTGTLTDTTDSETQYLWQCVGSNGGATASCSLDKTTPPVDVCSNLSGDQTTVPANMQTNSDHFCSCLTGYHEVSVDDSNNFTCDPNTPTETLTPTPTPAPNPGGPGDGKSDGRSDGRSSCPSCTQAPSGQVLGASTDEFASTGVMEDMLMNAVGAIGGLSTASGLVLAAKKKFNV